ncbi:glycosyltransferase family 4 protein [Novosphingobium sp.]|uniref:glycosyltransferase family 4 protein n=1 Tax=Novosphingobium sp. TaxID=1874826 RepID=UPI002732404E|nr:glycosyltransferase family 4 protein [Novosphingobium sp.]MDP3906641.1 glycosyltransferase family 4 protein [Novosphingobium sp.]
MAGQFDVLAIEVATTSQTYNWPPSGAITNATKLTLFPGQSYETISPLRRLWRELRALIGCRTVFVGIGYDRADIIALSWLLRLSGGTVVMMTDSKFDDRSRWAPREALKAMVLKAYSAVIVAGRQQRDFVHLLGHHRHRVVPGYDTVSIDRVRREALRSPLPPKSDWPFTFVGRFVPKKNLFNLLEAYALYVSQADGPPRRLQLIGSGELEAGLRAYCAELDITHLVDFPGFLSACDVSARLAASIALILISVEEQWGLVVNEAVALDVPVIVSTAVGSTDALVRNLCNGFIFEPDAVDGIAAALKLLAEDPQLRDRMSAAAHERAWLADTERFADAVQHLVTREPDAAATASIARFERSLAETG